MVLFNVCIGIAAAALSAIPVFFMKTKSGRLIGFIVALGIGAVFVGISNAYFYPEYLGWNFEREIKKQPLFSLIAQTNPDIFNQYIKDVKKNLREKEDPNLVSAYSANMVNKIFYQSLSHAPDDYIVLYLKATLELYHHLNGVDPRGVIKLENGSSDIGVDLNSIFEKKDFQALLNHLLDTKRYVIEASSKTPTAPPTDKQAEPLLQGVMTTLANKFGGDVVRSVFTNPKQIPANVGAQVIIEFYTQILALGPENAGMVMRFVSNLKSMQVSKPQQVTKAPH